MAEFDSMVELAEPNEVLQGLNPDLVLALGRASTARDQVNQSDATLLELHKSHRAAQEKLEKKQLKEAKPTRIILANAKSTLRAQAQIIGDNIIAGFREGSVTPDQLIYFDALHSDSEGKFDEQKAALGLERFRQLQPGGRLLIYSGSDVSEDMHQIDIVAGGCSRRDTGRYFAAR